MDKLESMGAELLMLQHVTTTLWANYIANAGGEPIEEVQRVAKESLANLEGLYERLEPGPGLHQTIQGVLHHEEGFWRQVEEQVRAIEQRRS